MGDLVVAVLQRHGYRPLAAATPDEAIELRKKHAGKIDLCVTGVLMNGQALAQRLRRDRSNLQVLFISVHADEEIFLFRTKFLKLLQRLHAHGELTLAGRLASLVDPGEWDRLLRSLQETEWVVYSKPPFGSPVQVLKYLARYTHRVAISNSRLLALRDGSVTFSWKDYAHDGRQATMTLTAVEFIRLFLLHVLPSGFVRIRHYGFLANRNRAERIALLRQLLGPPASPEPATCESPPESTHDGDTFEDPATCPVCKKGRLVVVATLLPQPSPYHSYFNIPLRDTS